MAHIGSIEHHEPKRSILIVEDNDANRELLEAILESEFEVFAAEDGLRGLELLAEHYEELSLVLLDVYMPRCDGFEFLRRKRQDARFDPVPVIVTTASDARADEIECLRLGANDFVVKPYNVDVIVNRISNTIHLRETASIVNQLTWDALTRLYSQEFFYRRVGELFSANPDVAYDIVCSDVANFKALNDRYGKQNCDLLLHDLAFRISELLPGFLAGGRLGNDTFAFLITHQPDHDWTGLLDEVPRGLFATNLSIKFGVVENVDKGIAVSLSCDRATLALDQVKDSFGVSVAWYNEELRQRQVQEQVIIESAEQALRDRQFVVYYQPKHDLATDETGGAEALVRWVHPELGFVRPDEFIPLFERNGFVSRLDLYVCEEACRQIRRLQDLGLRAVPISVNVSRMDFDLPDLAERIAALADAYGIDHALLHIELTETAYADNPDRVKDALTDLRREGFLIELDDFGSGYSALASLNVLPLDVMKLDMTIIRQAASLGDYRIAHAAIQMAQFLGLKTVAEGVETLAETQVLRELGCDYVQGYCYSRPLTKDEFETYMANGAGREGKR